MGSIAAARLSREILLLQRDPPPGAFCAPINDTLTEFEAQIQGPAGTVYEGGVFKLAIDIPTR